ncbi:MAG: trigger factor [Actinobacteria bacterium]|nr:trigger factor [Cyanobacteriota bacterium]MCL5771058.1 trigger factor [Actinomycetota bacterium]
MSYSIKSQEKIDKNKVKLNVEISSGYFNKSINTAYKNISEKAKIPGFRKGKVPYQIIDINYGKDYVLTEAANIAISELYSDIIESSNLKPVDYPKVDLDGELNQDKPVNFNITVEIEPDATLPDYIGVQAEGFPVEVTEEEVDKQVENLRNRFAALEPLGENDSIKNMDIVTIDFTGKIDEKEFEGGSSNDYVLEVGSCTLYKEIEDALIGMKKGEEKLISVEMPQELENKDIAGKKAEFKIKIKEAKRKTLPGLDSEFLKDIGDFETIEDLRKFIKENLEVQKKDFRRNKIFSDIVNYLVENSSIDIPQIMIDNEIKELKDDFERRLNEQNLTKEQYLEYFRINEDKINEDFRNKAIFNVKEYLIFNTLEKELKDKIEPTEEEILLEKENLIKSAKKEEDKKKVQDYLNSPSGGKNIIASVRRKKLVNFLIDNAKVKELTQEDLKKLEKDESEVEKNKENVSKNTKKSSKKSSKEKLAANEKIEDESKDENK